MGPKRTYLVVCAAVAACLALVAPADARHKHRHKPKPVYISGVYSGTVSQRSPHPVSGPIRFAVSGRTLRGLSVTVAELCGQLLWTEVTDAPKALRVSVARDGSFSYDRSVLGDHLVVRGHLRGNHASGTVFHSLTTGELSCTMQTASPFTANR